MRKREKTQNQQFQKQESSSMQGNDQRKLMKKKKKLKQLSRLKLPSKLKQTMKGDQSKIKQQFNFSIIRYKTFNTVRFLKSQQIYCQSDHLFFQDISSINQENKSLLNYLQVNQKEHILSQLQCDQIDYIARTHYLANLINDRCNLSKNQVNPKQLCPCDCKKIKGKGLGFCTNLNRLNYLGSGVILFFMFVKAIASMLLISLIVYGVYAVTTNLLGGDNKISEECTTGYCAFVDNSANNNKIQPNTYSVVQWWLGLLYCIFWLISIRFVKYFGRKKNSSIDVKLKSASDTAIIIKNLPDGQYSQSQLLQYFQKIWHSLQMQVKRQSQNQQKTQSNTKLQKRLQQMDNGNNFGMKSIQIIYSVDFSRKLTQTIISLSIKLVSLVQVKQTNQKNITYLIQQQDKQTYINAKNQLIQHLQLLCDLRKKFLYDQGFRKSISSTICIVQFQDQQHKDFMLKYYGKERIGLLTQLQELVKAFFSNKAESSLMFKGRYLQIQRAPEPSDILWKNCQSKTSIKRAMLIYFLTFLIILISLGIIVALQYIQSYFATARDQNSVIITIINVATSICLQITNRLLWFLLFYLIQIQNNYTLTQQINSHMNKSIAAISVNVIVLPIISNYYLKNQVFGTQGLSGMVFDYQITTLAVGLTLKLVNPVQIVKRLVLHIRKARNFVIRWFCKGINLADEDYANKGIKKINQFYQGAKFDIAESYVYILGVIFHAAFFCQIQPAVLIVATVIAILFYFVLKVQLLYFCKIPEITDKLVFETAITIAGMVPIIYGIGTVSLSVIQSNILPNRILQIYQGLICIGLGLLAFFNPGDFANRMTTWIMQKLEGWEWFKKIKPPKKAEEFSVNDTNYFQLSNSLELLGFQNKLRGSNIHNSIVNQLENFCQQFFPSKFDKKIIKQKIQKQTIQVEASQLSD